MNKTLWTSIFLLLLIGMVTSCGKETAPEAAPTPEQIQPEDTSERMTLDEPATEMPAEEPEPVQETPAPEMTPEPEQDTVEAAPPEPEQEIMEPDTLPEPASEPEPKPEPEPEPEMTEEAVDTPAMVAEIPQQQPEVSPEIFMADSSWDEYMIIPGDFLIKIAKKEYGDWQMWRKIYGWNREEIGDNPNLIYPYHFLDLLKPREKVEPCEVVYNTYTVQKGDNLWNIAGRTYGAEKSWIILFWDNEKLLDENDGVLYPGMTIKLREKLDPCAEM